MPMNVFALMFPIMKSYFERYVYKEDRIDIFFINL